MSKYLKMIQHSTNPEIDGPRISAIYFLFESGVLVYIGKTLNLKSRIGSHKRRIKENEFRFIRCSPERLQYYEERWIRRFTPPKNMFLYDGTHGRRFSKGYDFRRELRKAKKSGKLFVRTQHESHP